MSWCNLQRVNVTRVFSLWQTRHSASVSAIPVAVLCAEAALCTDKSLIKVHNSLTPTHPPTAECKPGDILSKFALQVWLQGSICRWNYSYGNTKLFFSTQGLLCVIICPFFISASNREGCKWPACHRAFKHAVWDLQFWCQMKVGKVEYRRWEGVYTWGCLKMMQTFSNEEMLHTSVGIQPYITSTW